MTTARLTFLGAARGVTGSCYHLEVEGVGLLIDCGTFQGDPDADRRNREPVPIDVPGLAGIVLTHGHLDHVGRTPVLANAGLVCPVFGHAATLDIARVILADSARIAHHAHDEPLYGAGEVQAIEYLMRALPAYGVAKRVGPFEITLYDAGHILGSSSVRVAWRDRAILFSGDLGVAGAPLLADPNTRWDPARDAVDYVVTESTYGDRTHPDRAGVRAELRRVIERALSDGGKVLIPAFSIGRTQEVLYELNAMIADGGLRGIPVVVDGPLGLSVTKIYQRHRGLYDEDAMALIARGDPPLEMDSLLTARDVHASRRAVNIEGPAIVIAGSGMCEGGRIRHHLLRHLPDPRTDVLLVGYQAGRTLGAALQQGRDRVWIGRDEVEVRARITTISGLSAHADRDGLADWFSHLPRRDGGRVFVTHGEPAQSEAYARMLGDRFGARADVPGPHDTVEL